MTAADPREVLADALESAASWRAVPVREPPRTWSSEMSRGARGGEQWIHRNDRAVERPTAHKVVRAPGS